MLVIARIVSKDQFNEPIISDFPATVPYRQIPLFSIVPTQFPRQFTRLRNADHPKDEMYISGH